MTGAAALDAASAEGAAAIAALPDLPPADAGTVLRDGTAIAYAAWGRRETAPSSSCRRGRSSTARSGRAQIRRFAPVARVVTFDARGSGRSGRPTAAGAYAPAETIADALGRARPPGRPGSRHRRRQLRRPLRRPDGRPGTRIGFGARC